MPCPNCGTTTDTHSPDCRRLHAVRMYEWEWNMIEEGRLRGGYRGRGKYIVDLCKRDAKKKKWWNQFKLFEKK